MKKCIIKVLSILLVLVTVFGMFSCKGTNKDYMYKNNTKDYVFRYGDYTVTEAFYHDWLAAFKANLMYTYSDIKNTNEYWDSKQGERTADEVFTEIADTSIKNHLMNSYLFSYYNLTISDSIIKTIDARLEEILTDGYDGNLAALNEEAYQYGINYNMLRQIYIAEAKSEIVTEYLKSSVLKQKLTDDEKEKFLRENYAHTTHIFISTEYEYNIDKDGNIIYDQNGGYTTDLTDEQKQQKQAKIAEVEAIGLTASNFAENQKKYNEDIAVDKYKNGYFVSANINFDPAYVSAALTMNEGEVKKVEGTNGTYFILKQPMTEKAYSDKANADFFGDFDGIVLDYLYYEYMQEICNDIAVNEEKKKGLTLKTVTPSWRF